MIKLVLILICTVTGIAVCHAQQTGHIRAGNLAVYYEINGKGLPVLLLHAGYQDHTMWKEQVAYFSKQYKVITFDLPGHGATTGVDSVTFVADVIRICLDTLHIQKVSIVGLSIGAACATDFVLGYPSRVNKLVLVSPGLSGWDEVVKMDSLSSRLIASMPAGDSSNDKKRRADVFTINWCDGPFRKPAGVDPSIRKYIYDHTLWTMENHQNDAWPGFQQHPHAAKMVGTIHKQLLVIYADKDIPFIKTCAIYFKKSVKGARLIIFTNAGHMLNMEQPNKFNTALNNFLK